MTPDPRIGTIVYERGEPIDELLEAVARDLRARGVAVAGLVQHNIDDTEGGRCRMQLEDVRTGRRYAISQTLGAESQSCSLDSTVLAEATAALRQAVVDRAALVIINKFSDQEVEGGGLRDEIGLVAAAGIPLLIGVARRFLPQWREFLGGEPSSLACDAEAVRAWIARNVAVV